MDGFHSRRRSDRIGLNRDTEPAGIRVQCMTKQPRGAIKPHGESEKRLVMTPVAAHRATPSIREHQRLILLVDGMQQNAGSTRNVGDQADFRVLSAGGSSGINSGRPSLMRTRNSWPAGPLTT